MKRRRKGKKLRTDQRDLKIMIKKLEREIPEFKQCKQCGECCGPIMVTTPEYRAIILELSRTDQFPLVAGNLLRKDETMEGDPRETCPLLIIEGDPRDINNRKTKCMVYKKRPILCRAQAVTPGMPCEFDSRDIKTKRNIKLWKKYGELAANDRIRLRPAITEYINQWVIQHDIDTGKIQTVKVSVKDAMDKAKQKEESDGT